MRSYWFGDVAPGGCTRAVGDTGALVDRLNSIVTTPGDTIPPDWRLALECGAVKDRADYLSRLREICIQMAKDRIIVCFQGKEMELIQMVMLLEGLDQAANQLTERLADWHRILHPGKGWKYRPRDSRKILAWIGKDAEGSMER